MKNIKQIVMVTLIVFLLLLANAFTLGSYPASFIFLAGNQLAVMLFNENLIGHLERDSYWPIFLEFGFIWPFSLLLVYIIVICLYKFKVRCFREKISRILMFIIFELLFTVALSIYFRLQYVN